jgi:nitrite reductase (NO-forming)
VPRSAFGGAVLVAILLTGCGGSGGGGTHIAYKRPIGPAASTVKVTAGNFYFQPKRLSAKAGVVGIDFSSADTLHTFVIQGIDGFKLESSGNKTTGKVDLKPGKYTFYCDIPGHRAQGMVGTLTISRSTRAGR